MFIDRYNLCKILKTLYGLIELAKQSEDSEVLFVLALCARQLDILTTKRFADRVYPGGRCE